MLVFFCKVTGSLCYNQISALEIMSKNTLIFALGFIPLLLILVLIILVNNQPKAPQTDNTPQISISPTIIPDPKDTIRAYFTYIDNGEISKALDLLSTRFTGNEPKEDNPVIMALTNTYANWSQVELLSIAKAAPLDEEFEPTYMVNFTLELKESNEELLWNNGDNTRFITLALEKGEYKIIDIATGP